MLRTTVWRPDTCGCEIAYSWDDSVPQESRTHTIADVKHCHAHADVVMPAGATLENDAHPAAEQNRRKNIAHGHALTLIPEIAETAADGSVALKRGATMDWAWSGSGASRVLTLTYTGVNFPAGRKSALQAKCDAVFGSGKVVIV